MRSEPIVTWCCRPISISSHIPPPLQAWRRHAPIGPSYDSHKCRISQRQARAASVPLSMPCHAVCNFIRHKNWNSSYANNSIAYNLSDSYMPQRSNLGSALSAGPSSQDLATSNSTQLHRSSRYPRYPHVLLGLGLFGSLGSTSETSVE